MCLEHVWKIFKYFKLIMQKSCFLLSLLARVPGKLLLNSRENFEINKTCNTFLGGGRRKGEWQGGYIHIHIAAAQAQRGEDKASALCTSIILDYVCVSV